MNNDKIDNVLVAMKDEMLARLNAEQPKEEWVKVASIALQQLQFILPLWATLSYAYKAKEIAERIRSKCESLEIACGHYTFIRRIAEVRQTAIKVVELAHAAHMADKVLAVHGQ